MVLRIGLTGAPYAGKTEATYSLVDIPGLIIVPEAATLLYEIGFPKRDEVGMSYKTWMLKMRPMFVPARIAIQKALEESMIIKARHTKAKACICDRMIGDSVTYYKTADEFLREAALKKEEILSRYDMVIFLESLLFLRGMAKLYNRQMPAPLARRSHAHLLEIYGGHPNFHYVKATPDLSLKITEVRELILRALLGR